MTLFTNREGAVDHYDETAIKAVEDEARRYVRMNRKAPYTIGVSAEQQKEIKKAEKAGIRPTIQYKGAPFVISTHLSTGSYRYPMMRTNHEPAEVKAWK